MKGTEISPVVLGAPCPMHGLLHDQYSWEGFKVLNKDFLLLSSFLHVFSILLSDPFSTRKER